MDDDEFKTELSGDDAALWAAVTKDIAPLKGKDPVVTVSTKKSKTPKRVSNVVETLVPSLPTQRLSVQAPQGHEVDRNTLKRFRRGDMLIDARLDLHGFNQGQAHEALQNFILSSHASGYRCVLVITGKGRTGATSEAYFDHEPGILKRKVPEWLADPILKPHILKVSEARKHGGAGALYVLLRRKREIY